MAELLTPQKTERGWITLFRTAAPALTITLAILFSISGRANAPARAHLVILSTTDMHGRIFPIDYYTNRYDNDAMAKPATLGKEARKKDPHLSPMDSFHTTEGRQRESL